MSDKNRVEIIERIGELIKSTNISMLTTAEPDGTLHSRPMGTLNDSEQEFDGKLYFFTRLDSAKTDEINNDHDVSVTYADAGKNSYVALSGKARVSQDRALIEKLWTPIAKAWFPEGKDDPQLAVLTVTATQGEYWDGSSSKIVQLIGMAKAAITGNYDMGENEKVSL